MISSVATHIMAANKGGGGSQQGGGGGGVLCKTMPYVTAVTVLSELYYMHRETIYRAPVLPYSGPSG